MLGIIARNAGALYGIAVVNYLSPLILIPFLTRALGPSGFGLFMMGQAVTTLLGLVGGWGLDVVGTRRIATVAVSGTVDGAWSEIWGARLVTSVAVLAVVGISVMLFEDSPLMRVVALQVGVAIGATLSPSPLFQGMQKMELWSISVAGARAVGVVAVLALVRGPGDLWVAAVIQSLQGLVAVLLGLILAKRLVAKPAQVSDFGLAWAQLKAGTEMVMALVIHRVYTGLNTVVVGAVAGLPAAAVYGVAEKVLQYVLAMLGPIPQALFPRHVERIRSTPGGAQAALLWVLSLMGGGAVLLVLVALGLAGPLATLFGPGFGDVAELLRLIIWAALPAAIGHVLGTLGLQAAGRDSTYLRILAAAGSIHIACALFFTRLWGAPGMALAYVLSETIVATGFVFAIFPKRGAMTVA